jgi:hypothetical protein
VYTVVIDPFMVHVMVPLTVSFMVDDMAWTKNGRWENFQVLHSDLGPKPRTPSVSKMLISWGFL